MSKFEEAFERMVPSLVATAWDYTNRSPLVELIWVYIQFDNMYPIAVPYYQIAGEALEAHRVKTAIPGIDFASRHLQMLDDLGELAEAMFDEVGDRGQIPFLMVLKFSPADQDFQADFSWQDVFGDTPIEKRETLHYFAQRWFERLRTTGDDSAVLIPKPVD